MILLEVALLAGLVWAVVVGTSWLAGRSRGRRVEARPCRWRAAHFDLRGETHVVLRRFAERGDHVLDEHRVATISVSDPEYDAKFLTAMALARERRALFEAEEND